MAVVLLAAGSPAPPVPEWKVLFDGRSTDAWRGSGGESFPTGCWAVEGDTLKTVTGAERACDLFSREKYRDFELELDWKVSPGGNSGILYRVAELPGAPAWHSGPEMQLLDDDRYRENPARTHAGALYDLIAPTGKTLRPAGEWNQARLVVRGTHVEHWLNGSKVVAYELGSDAFRGLVARSKFKDLPRFAREPEGHVVLQHHSGGDVWFRNVRMRAPR
jgi:hypothetical protein